ncbi:MAG: polysaccharide deacetylase family protein [Acidobacteriia bacterium]|nr:polysaccharide deacetylase family protein [Terriglobia bacterium]
MRTKSVLSAVAEFSYQTGLANVFRWVGNFLQLRRDSAARVTFPYVEKRQARNFQIFTYHRLSAHPDPFFPGLPITVFEQQIRYLTRYHRVVELGQLLRDIERGEPIPRNAVALTFDDGYRDNYELAFPILQEYGAPATIFLTTGFLDRHDVLWNDKICFAFKHTSKSGIAFDTGGRTYYPLKTVEDRLRAAQEILWFMRHIPHYEKVERIDQLLSNLGISDFRYLWDTMLSWEHVLSMHRQGIAFGAHTVSHPILSRLALAQAQEEIMGSKTTIELQLGCPVELFAYPAGASQDYTEDLKRLLVDAGFKAAVTTNFGTNTARTDRFELRRNWMLDDPHLSGFAARILWYKFSS